MTSYYGAFEVHQVMDEVESVQDQGRLDEHRTGLAARCGTIGIMHRAVQIDGVDMAIRLVSPMAGAVGVRTALGRQGGRQDQWGQRHYDNWS